METKSLLNRIIVLVAAMMCALSASAVEAYACYTPSNRTLTFYFDDQRIYRSGNDYDLNKSSINPGWVNDLTCADVTRVVFDPSFANAPHIGTSRQSIEAFFVH